jgi:SAM-dependent methyltransferase
MNIEAAIQKYADYPACDLCRIFDEYKSDKGFVYHNYSRLYNEILLPIRYEKVHIFEMGIGTNDPTIESTMGKDGTPGASLRAWKQYFPYGKIYGADIDKKIVFEEERIKTFYCDQLKQEDIHAMWNSEELKDVSFDLILDDGLHSVDAIICFFSNSIHKLKRGGVFIAEDLGVQLNEQGWLDLIEKIKHFYPFLRFHFLRVKQDRPRVNDNCVFIAQRIS